MKNKITVIGLKQNGEPFNPTTFSINDNLDAIFINSGDVANTRVVAYGSDTVLQSNSGKNIAEIIKDVRIILFFMFFLLCVIC